MQCYCNDTKINLLVNIIGPEGTCFMLSDLIIDRKSAKTVSQQIAHFLRGKIQSKELKPGEKLPSTQELRSKFGIGTNTVRQAMSELESDGLVRSRPRVGTIVSESPATSSPLGTNKKMRRIAIIGLVTNIDSGFRFRPESAEGIVMECNRLGVMMTMLPNSFLEMDKEQACLMLKSMGCEGVIWLSHRDNEQFGKYLISQGFPFIRHLRYRTNHDLSCVGSDYDSGGCNAGHYLYSCGCKRVDIISHFNLDCGHEKATANGYPLGIKHSIARAFEIQGREVHIGYHVFEKEDESVGKPIFDKVASLPVSSGLVFFNAHQLLWLLKYQHSCGKNVLKDRKIVVVSNKTINILMAEYVEGLDIMVLLDVYEEIGKTLTDKLVRMIEGVYDEQNSTLVEIKLMSFQDAMKML